MNAAAERLTAADLAGLFGCAALALGAHIGSVPAWVLATAVAVGAIRLGLAHGGRGAPPLAIRATIAVASAGIIYLQFRTFNGLTAGSALLALMTGLKLLETERRRDLYVVTLLIYFMTLSSLLLSDSFWLLAYAIAVCWLTTVMIFRLTTSSPRPAWSATYRYCGKLLLQALPLALAFWLFFPRFGGPLWHIPSDDQSATSGLSDSMSPGDINQLALSDEIAFRVRFGGATPPANQRYWRGPVLHDFDGHTWRRGHPGPARPPTLLPRGPAYSYTLSLEPHAHEWVFALDWPSRWDLPGGGTLTSDYMLVRREPVSRPIDLHAVSHTEVEFPSSLPGVSRRPDTNIARAGNPRSHALALELRQKHSDDEGYVQAVLDLFAHQSFYYTLTPPKLADDSIDAFLFDTKRGFCGHYASAFAFLMRAGGVPAHVVTGYAGGTFNPYSDTWIVKQSEAHAWDEVWIEGRGWVRVDPTSVISPARVDPGIAASVAGTESLIAGRWRSRWLVDWRLRLDAFRQLWRERILLFDQSSQEALLEALYIPEPDGQKLVIVLTAVLALMLGWLTWSVRREATLERSDPLLRAYAHLCTRLGRLGLARRPHEGPESYAQRIAGLRPDLATEVSRFCRRFSSLRYEAMPSAAGVREFARAVRSFRPRAALGQGAPGKARGGA